MKPPRTVHELHEFSRIIEPQIGTGFHRFHLNIIIILVLIRVNQCNLWLIKNQSNLKFFGHYVNCR